MLEPLTRLEGVDGFWVEVAVGACVEYVPLTTTVVVATGRPVPFAKALEAKMEIRRRVKARFVKVEVEHAIVVEFRRGVRRLVG